MTILDWYKPLRDSNWILQGLLTGSILVVHKDSYIINIDWEICSTGGIKMCTCTCSHEPSPQQRELPKIPAVITVVNYEGPSPPPSSSRLPISLSTNPSHNYNHWWLYGCSNTWKEVIPVTEGVSCINGYHQRNPYSPHKYLLPHKILPHVQSLI